MGAVGNRTYGERMSRSGDRSYRERMSRSEDRGDLDIPYSIHMSILWIEKMLSDLNKCYLWKESPILPPFRPSILPSFHPSALPSFHSSILPFFHPSVLPFFHPSTLPSFQPINHQSCHSLHFGFCILEIPPAVVEKCADCTYGNCLRQRRRNHRKFRIGFC